MHDVIIVIGALTALAGLLALLFSSLKQSTIIAFIVTGILGKFLLPLLHVEISHDIEHLFHALQEIGIILLLFMAGLEVDLKSFLSRWKLVLINGAGQILLNALAGIAIGYFFLETKSMATLAFFGLCLTFSSTIIVIGTLKSTKSMESLHGQIILGLMVLQDIVAVISLSILQSMGTGGDMGAALIGFAIKLIATIVILTLLSKFVLKHLFKKFAEDKELLFIGTVGYVLGVASICAYFHFSAEIGAFLAGASIAMLPYRHSIEDKVDPLKTFGVILFFITLGYGLKFPENIAALILPVVMVSSIVVFGTPLLMLILGKVSHLKSRPAFLIGGTVNQISEFSLILAFLAKNTNIDGEPIFSETTFLLVTLSCLFTIFLSTLGHKFLGNIYNTLKTPLSKFMGDAKIKYGFPEHHSDFKLENHVVILGYNEISNKIAEHFASLREKVLVLDVDPDIYHHFAKVENNIVPLYADMEDPDVWEDVKIENAKLVVSTMIGGQKSEIALVKYLKAIGNPPPFVAATDSYKEALELYEDGVDYVIQTEHLAAEYFKSLLASCLEDYSILSKHKEAHLEELKRGKAEHLE